MPMHDWTRVEAGIFHDMHICWVAQLQGALNQGVLPDDYYALAEYHPVEQPLTRTPDDHKGKRRTIAIRHTSSDRLIALIEMTSPANKDRLDSVAAFCTKVRGALQGAIHVLLLDVFPPGPADPLGMHGAVWKPYDAKKHAPPDARPLTFAAYAAGKPLQAFVNHLAVGDDLPDMPLFLSPTKYVNTPLEETYAAAYAGMPAFWRKVLEKKPA